MISQIIFICYLFKIYGSKGKNESNNFPPLSKASAHATGKTSLLLRSIIVSQKANWWLLKIKKYMDFAMYYSQYILVPTYKGVIKYVESLGVMVFDPTFNNICYIGVVSIIGGGNPRPISALSPLLILVTQVDTACYIENNTWQNPYNMLYQPE